MPTSLNPIVASGQTTAELTPYVYVTYDSNQLGYGAPLDVIGNQDQVPSFMFYMGSPAFYKDSNGDVRAVSPNRDGSIPT